MVTRNGISERVAYFSLFIQNRITRKTVLGHGEDTVSRVKSQRFFSWEKYKDRSQNMQIHVNTQASDFTLNDMNGHAVSLSDYTARKHVLLVFNRSFL